MTLSESGTDKGPPHSGFVTPRHPFRPLRLLLDGGFALLLVGTLLVVYALDSRTSEPEPPPPSVVDVVAPPPIDPTLYVRLAYTPDGRFGVATTTGKKLTYEATGGTNNTCVWVDGSTALLGGQGGRTVEPVRQDAEGRLSFAWEYHQVRVEQQVEYTAGELSRRMDAVRVTYSLRNTDSQVRTAGLRVMIDTLIGSNDGVPFIVPGHEGLVTTPQTYRGEQVPDFVRALEYPDLVNPGVIVDIGLPPSEGERPGEVTLTHWPGSNAGWDYNRSMPFGSDTAIGLYYQPQALPPGETRSMQFTYGLGTISSEHTKNASLSLTAGGPFRAGGRFWLVALVKQGRGQRVRLTLPDGLMLTDARETTKPVPDGKDYTQVSWLVGVAPTCLGNVEVKAVLEPSGTEERLTLNVLPPVAGNLVRPR